MRPATDEEIAMLEEIPPPPVRALPPVYGPASVEEERDMLARAVSAMIEFGMRPPKATDVWADMRARADEDGAVHADAMIEVLRKHGLR
jgi:hypothetical protein